MGEVYQATDTNLKREVTAAFDRPAQVENAIADALFDSRQWTLTREEMSATLALCVMACRSNVAARIRIAR